MRKRILAFLIDHIIICFAFAMLGMVEVFVKTDFELFWKLYYIFSTQGDGSVVRGFLVLF